MAGEQYDIGITDGFSGHPSVERTEIDIRTVCVFPQGHALGQLKEITPSDLINEKLIHSRRDSVFFKVFPKHFNVRKLNSNQVSKFVNLLRRASLLAMDLGYQS